MHELKLNFGATYICLTLNVFWAFCLYRLLQSQATSVTCIIGLCLLCYSKFSSLPSDKKSKLTTADAATITTSKSNKFLCFRSVSLPATSVSVRLSFNYAHLNNFPQFATQTIPKKVALMISTAFQRNKRLPVVFPYGYGHIDYGKCNNNSS